MTESPIWSKFRIDPRRHTPLRASDEDRDIVRDYLGDAFADGRLDRAEFDGRLVAVDEARLLGDLLVPLNDLVLDAHPIAPGDDEGTQSQESRSSPSSARIIRTGHTAHHGVGGDRPAPRLSRQGNPPLATTPEEIEAAARAHHAKLFRASLSTFAGASAITTLIWLALGLFGGGFGGFWPIFVMLGTGIGVISAGSRRSQIIDERRRALTRQAREYRELQGLPPVRGAAGATTPTSHDADRRELRRQRSRTDNAASWDEETTSTGERPAPRSEDPAPQGKPPAPQGERTDQPPDEQ